MNSILNWLKSQSISAHSVAATAGVLATLIVSDQALRNAVLDFFHAHPKIGTELVALATIITTYQKATKGDTQPPSQPSKETQ